jgi:hypothetical protein
VAQASRRWLAALILSACGCAPPEGDLSSVASGPAPSLTWRFIDPDMDCDDEGNVYITGAEQFPETAQILVAHSSQYGEAWTPHFSYVNTSTVGDRGRPQLLASNASRVYVLWEDTRDGPLHVYLNRSLDAGRTWLHSDRRVNAQESRGRGISTPRMAGDDRNVSVVWLDDHEGFEAFYCNLSTDAGESWMPVDARITEISVGHKSAPTLVGDHNGGRYLAWAEEVGTRQVVRFSLSRDHGRNWSLQPQTLSMPGMEAQRILPVGVAILELGDVIVAWTQYHNGVATTWMARSEDRGQTWFPPLPLQSEQEGLFNPSAPLVLAESYDRLHISWQAMTQDRIPVLITKSSDDRGRRFVEKRMTRRRLPVAFLVDYRTVDYYLAPFSMAGDNNGSVYFSWVDVDVGRGRLAFRRLGNDVDIGFDAPADLDTPGQAPATTVAPRLCADMSGHVYLLWNEARSLSFATSPFHGDAGWRFEKF